jgi:hypothetical protein
VIPVPLSVNSTATLQLSSSGIAIGQASATFTAGEFTEGAANTIVTPFTFQPLVEDVIVGAADANAQFDQGYASSPFGATLFLIDTVGEDLGGDMDGALDMSGNPLTSVVLTSSDISPSPPSSVTIGTGSPASDISLGTYTFPGASTQPDISPSGSNDVNYVALSGSSPYTNVTGADPYSWTTHGFNVATPVGPAWSGGGYTFSYEYPQPSAVPTPAAAVEFTANENIPADTSNAAIILDVTGGVPNGNSNCLALFPFDGTSSGTYNSNVVTYVPLALPATYFIDAPTGGVTTNGTCAMELVDGFPGAAVNPGNVYDYTIYVNNPTLYVDGKARRK